MKITIGSVHLAYLYALYLWREGGKGFGNERDSANDEEDWRCHGDTHMNLAHTLVHAI